ncbi:MAG: HEAT repeat domain-containing protein [Myxococcales bacterium]|nr:HEAT repeat domain-containing protein [Myxococcales bacterium]
MRYTLLICLLFSACDRPNEAPAPAPDAAAEDPVARLEREVRTGDPTTRIAAAAALGRMGQEAGRAVKALGEALDHPETRVQLAALNALDQLARAGVAMGALTDALGRVLTDGPTPVKVAAANLLGHARAAAASAVPLLQARLGDQAAEVRAAAARALGRIGPDAKGAVQALAAHIDDADMAVRLWSRQAITALDSEHPASLRGLMVLLGNTRLPEAARSQAEEILRSWVEGTPAEVAPVLKEILEETLPGAETEVRWIALRAVRLLAGDGGDLARSITPILLETLKDPEATVREAAVATLAVVGKASGQADRVNQALRAVLTDADVQVRRAAAEGLGWLGDRVALPSLQKAMDDPAGAVRAAALMALGAVVGKEDAARLLPLMEGKLKDADASVRAAAAAALGVLGALLDDIGAVLKPLMAAVSDDAEEVALAALAAIKGLGARAADALPAVMDALSSGSSKVKTAAADALGALGDKAREAGPALRRLVGQGDEDLDQALKQALEAVEASK